MTAKRARRRRTPHCRTAQTARGRRRFGVLALPLGAAVLGSCAGVPACIDTSFGKDEAAAHYLIVGVGLVSVPRATDGGAVLTSKATVLGLSLSQHPMPKLGLGYVSWTDVAVPDRAEDVRIEVSQRPGGPLRVEAARVAIAPEGL